MKRILSKLKRDGFLQLVVAIVKYPFGHKKRLAYQKMLVRERIEDRFSDIYARNLWSSPESLSGAGSEFGYTASLRNWLVRKIHYGKEEKRLNKKEKKGRDAPNLRNVKFAELKRNYFSTTITKQENSEDGYAIIAMPPSDFPEIVQT